MNRPRTTPPSARLIAALIAVATPIAAAAAAAVIGSDGSAGEDHLAPAPESIADRTAAVMPTIAGAPVLPGRTTARRLVTVSSTFDARLLKVLVRDGQRVRAGDVIARLDDRTMIATAALAREEATHRGRLDRMEERLRQARVHLDRVQTAVDGRGASDVELDRARSEVILAEADVREATELRRAAERKHAEAQARLDTYTLRAPFDGTVLRTPVEAGAAVTSGEAIAEIATLDDLTVELHLPAAVAMQIAPGEAYSVELRAPVARVVRARVRYVEPRIDLASNTMRTILDLDPAAITIPIGVVAVPADRVLSAAERAQLYPSVDRTLTAGADPRTP